MGIPCPDRNWLQPLIYHSSIQILNFLGIKNPFTEVFFLRLLSTMIALFSSWKIYEKWKDDFHDHKIQTWVLGILFLLWYFLFFHARTSSENLSSSLFLLGLAQWHQFKGQELMSKRHFHIGVLYGLSFLFRFQSCFYGCTCYALYFILR